MKMIIVTACLVIVALVNYAATVKTWKQRYGKSDTKSVVQTHTPDETVFAKSLQTRIIGGTIAKHGDIPWQARLDLVTSYGKSSCGASIIDEFWLVSAAHCLINASEVNVTVGNFDLNTKDIGEQTFTVNSTYIHEEYDDVIKDNDIALLRIKPSNKGRGIVFNKFVQPIRLPDAGTDLKEGTMLLVSGWGWTLPSCVDCKNESRIISEVLKKAEIPVVDQSTCQRLLRGIVTSRKVCAGSSDGVPDTCIGDSGGPAAYKTEGQYVLYGIVSSGRGCAKPGIPGVYTRVTSFLPWIKSKMQL